MFLASAAHTWYASAEFWSVAGTAVGALCSAAAGVLSIRRRQRRPPRDGAIPGPGLGLAELWGDRSEDIIAGLQGGEAEPTLAVPRVLSGAMSSHESGRSVTLEQLRELLEANRRELFRDALRISTSFFAASVFVSVMITLLVHPIGS